MRRYLQSFPGVTIRYRLGDYARAMMIKRILTICAAVAAGAAATSLASAQNYPPPPGSGYSTAPQPYPPTGYPADYRRAPGSPDFDSLQDDEAAPTSTALPPPGPVLSPDDPRYGRPMGAPPLYNADRGAPTGPVLSPDDPRYGRPAGPPPVIYSDRPGGQPQQTTSDRDNGAPASGCIYPNDDLNLRPPGAVGSPSGATAAT